MFQALRSNRWYVPLITIGVFVVLFAVYYFVYVSWQRNYANDRAFRLLSVVGDQLGKKFANLKSVFAAALVASSSPTALSPADYLAGVPVYKGQISGVESRSPCPPDWNRQGDMTLKLGENTGNLSLRVMFQSASGSKGSPCTLSADVNAGLDLRERFHDLTADYFDDLLIATSTGEVLFESNRSGIRITSLSALVSPSSPAASASGVGGEIGGKPTTFAPFQQASQYSNVMDVQLAGAAYKLYVQPVPLEIKRGDQTVTPVVCGLWRADRLQSEVVSIPYATIIWIALIALAVFGLLWPLLKVAYMSPAERLQRVHVFYLLFSALFVCTTLTAIVLNLGYTLLDQEEAREQVKSLADRVDHHVKAELAQALTLMNAVEQGETYFQPRLRAATPKNWTDSDILLKLPGAAYPYFDNMFWADQQGVQIYKMTVRPSPTPQTSVAAESFFRDARDCRHLTTLNGSDAVCQSPAGQILDAGATPFRFDSLYSPNTGEFIAVVSKPHQGTPGDGLDKLKVQVLVTKFVSLVDPVVPAGYGYAVVDHDGLVQFHSSSSRNHIENFFKECRQDAALKALVTKGSRDFVDVDYTGRRQLMLVRPLPYLADPALTLIVFRDTNYFTTVNVACMLVFAIFVGLLSIPWLAGLVIYIFRVGDYPLAHLWPSAVQNATYVKIIAANVCLAAAFALCFSSMGMERILWTSLGVAAAGAFFGLSRPKWAKERRSLLGRAVMLLIILAVAQWSWGLLAAAAYIVLSLPRVSQWLDGMACDFKLRYVYLAAVISLLIVVVVLPCFGVFKISYQSVNRLALESAQLDRSDLLTHRADGIREYFSALSADPKLVDRRIAEDLDRYDDAVFWPADPGGRERGDEPLSRLEMWIASATGWFPANDFGSQLRQMAIADADGSGPNWHYARGKDDEILRLSGLSRKVVPGGELKGVYPIWTLPRKAGALIAILAVLLAAWLSKLIRRVFLTDLAKVPPLTPWKLNENGARNLLVVGHPKSGKRTRAAALAGAQMLDLAEIVTSENWTMPNFTGQIVVLDHFEFDIDNPNTLVLKLKLLEELLYLAKKRIVLLSAVDPMFYLAASTPEIMSPAGSKIAPAQLLDRWATVLSAFDKRQMEDVTESYISRYLAERDTPCLPELVRLVKLECDHTAELRRLGLALMDEHCGQMDISQALFVEQLLDRADTYYRVLWSNCTKEERLVLFQLARDGWANPKNDRAIQQLERRRLVRRSPGLRIMNESFCRFVHTAQLPSEVARWEEEQQQSTWSAVKTGLTTAVFMAGAWLLYTQQDIFQLGIGYVAALGTASGVVLNLARSVASSRKAKTGEGA